MPKINAIKLQLIFLVAVFLLGPMGIQAGNSIAVLNLKSDQLSQTTCISVTNFISTELQTYHGLRIIAWDDVTKILEHKAGVQALGCDNDKCIVEIGDALGVDYIIAGDIGQLGSKYICNLKLIDINKASIRSRVSETIVGDIGALTNMIPSMVHNLLYTYHAAARIGSLPEIERIYRTGADVNEKEDSSGLTPLHVAVFHSNDAIVQSLLAKGADANLKDAHGDTPLQIAVRDGHEAIVHTLIDSGANVNTKDNSGETPLLTAALNGSEAIVKALLDRGADVNAKDSGGFTPLHQAAFWGHASVVKALLDKGANMNAKTNVGYTPLYCAASVGHIDVVEILLSKGAKVNIKNNDGLTPLGIATLIGKADIVKLLKKHGATE